MNLTDYILLSKEERISHIQLSSPCAHSHFSEKWRRKIARENILSFLGVKVNVSNWNLAKVCICHLCENNSVNGYCENPLHIYLGTRKENFEDIPLQIRRSSQSKGALQTNKQRWISLYDGYISSAGNVARHNRKLGVDPNLRVKIQKGSDQNA